MPGVQKENGQICFEIDNVRIYVAFDDGFFNLNTTHSRLHNHSRYEMHLTLDGISCIKTESGIFSMHKSEGYVIAPETVHNCLTEEAQTVKSSFWFSFEKLNTYSKRDVYSLFERAFGSIGEIKKITNAEGYISILQQIILEYYSENLFATEKIKSLFSLLMMQLAEELLPKVKTNAEAIQTGGSSAGEEKILRRMLIEEYINRNYNKNISLESLAEVLHLSRKQAGRAFVSEFGINFKDYIIKFRINLSLYLLQQTDLAVVKIASLVGYKSYNGFYKAFSAHIGTTPEQYRKQKQ